jgi:pathogenicity locus Cdd1 protein
VKSPDRETVKKLDALPNIGKALSADLKLINITHPKQLIGRDAYQLHSELCIALGFRQDYCVIDVLLSAIDYMEGGKAQPWWHFTVQRKQAMATTK